MKTNKTPITNQQENEFYEAIHRANLRRNASKSTKDRFNADDVFSTMNNYNANNLIAYISQLYGNSTAFEYATDYQIGTQANPLGTTVFWRLNKEGDLYSREAVLFDPLTGKRQNEALNEPSIPSKPIAVTDIQNQPYLFGEQLLNKRPEANVALVWLEETALITAPLYPEWVWLAIGRSSKLHRNLFNGLTNRNIILIPDVTLNDGILNTWNKVAEILQPKNRVQRFNYLQDRATYEEKKAGLSIGDYLTQHRCRVSGRVLSEQDGYPALWDVKN